MRGKKSFLFVIPFGVFLTFSAHAGDKTKSTTVDCNRDSLQAEIDKLDRSIPNVVEFTGNCPGLITVDGHRDLTLVGIEPASISGVYVPGDRPASTSALDVFNSRITIQDATIDSGDFGLFCSERSTCILRDVIVQGGHIGVAAQDSSAVDVLGSSQILDGEQFGVAGFGASSVNMRPNWDLGFDPTEPGPVVTGNSIGIFVQDGSFFRSDNVLITENGQGVQARRDAVIKIFPNESGLGVTNNDGDGLVIQQNSSAQVFAPVTGNGGSGITLGSLSFLQAFNVFDNGGEDVNCADVTAVSSFYCPSLGQTISDLQAQVAALTDAAGATLEQKVAGKTYVVRTTAHGSGGQNSSPQPTPPLLLDNPQRDFSLADGTLTLAEDGSYDLQLLLTIVPMTVSGFYQEINDLPLGNSGTWAVDVSTNEIVLNAVVDGEVVEEQRLQSTPSGEVLTIVSNDQRLVTGDPAVGGFFNTFYADAVYIQLPDSE